MIKDIYLCKECLNYEDYSGNYSILEIHIALINEYWNLDESIISDKY